MGHPSSPCFIVFTLGNLPLPTRDPESDVFVSLVGFVLSMTAAWAVAGD